MTFNKQLAVWTIDKCNQSCGIVINSEMKVEKECLKMKHYAFLENTFAG